MGRSHWRYAMHLALATGVPLDGGVFARPPRADRAAKRRALAREQGPGARYVAPLPEVGPLPAEAVPLPRQLPPVPGPLACERWEVLLVCRRRG